MKIIISSFLLGMALSSNAQFHKSDKVVPMFTHSIGGSFQQFDGLNGRIANQPQFKQLKDYTATLGLGWMKDYKHVISAGSITLGSSMSGDRDERSSTIRYAAINFDIGYDVVKSDKVMLYPLVGLGFQHYQAIFFKDNSTVPFDDVLTSTSVKNTISSVRFNNSFFVYRAGLGVSVQPPKCPGTSIGIQAGYAGSFKEQAWKSNESQALANAPTDNISQVFASIVFTTTPKFMNRNK